MQQNDWSPPLYCGRSQAVRHQPSKLTSRVRIPSPALQEVGMKIDAVEVTSTHLQKTAEFYELLGFRFPAFKADEDHLEPINPQGSARLMIDSQSMVKNLLGADPQPSNHSSFALYYDTPAEVDRVTAEVKKAGFTVVTEPWDAFWGQRYAIVQDPDGYKVDLFSPQSTVE